MLQHKSDKSPNEDDPKFYNNLFLTISNLSRHYVVVGDFNCPPRATQTPRTTEPMYIGPKG